MTGLISTALTTVSKPLYEVGKYVATGTVKAVKATATKAMSLVVKGPSPLSTPEEICSPKEECPAIPRSVISSSEPKETESSKSSTALTTRPSMALVTTTTDSPQEKEHELTTERQELDLITPPQSVISSSQTSSIMRPVYALGNSIAQTFNDVTGRTQDRRNAELAKLFKDLEDEQDTSANTDSLAPLGSTSTLDDSTLKDHGSSSTDGLLADPKTLGVGSDSIKAPMSSPFITSTSTNTDSVFPPTSFSTGSSRESDTCPWVHTTPNWGTDSFSPPQCGLLDSPSSGSTWEETALTTLGATAAIGLGAYKLYNWGQNIYNGLRGESGSSSTPSAPSSGSTTIKTKEVEDLDVPADFFKKEGGKYIAKINGKKYEILIFHNDGTTPEKNVTENILGQTTPHGMKKVAHNVCELIGKQNLLKDKREASVTLGMAGKNAEILDVQVDKASDSTALSSLKTHADAPKMLGLYASHSTKIDLTTSTKKATTPPAPTSSSRSSRTSGIDKYLHNVEPDGHCGPHAICHGLSLRYKGSDKARHNLLYLELQNRYKELSGLKNLPNNITKQLNSDLFIDMDSTEISHEECQIMLRHLNALALTKIANNYEKRPTAKFSSRKGLPLSIMQGLRDDFKTHGIIPELLGITAGRITALLSKTELTGSEVSEIMKYRAEYWSNYAITRTSGSEMYAINDFFEVCAKTLKPWGVDHIAMVKNKNGGTLNIIHHSDNAKPYSMKNTLFIYHNASHYQSFENNPATNTFLEGLFKKYNRSKIEAFLLALQDNNPGATQAELQYIKNYFPESFKKIEKLIKDKKLVDGKGMINITKRNKADEHGNCTLSSEDPVYKKIRKSLESTTATDLI